MCLRLHEINYKQHNGVNIRPSARKPLHSSCAHCCLSYIPLRESMGRYGIRKDKNRSMETTMVRASSDREGTDELDCVQSKLQHKYGEDPRRHSADGVKQRKKISNESDHELSPDISSDREIYSPPPPTSSSSLPPSPDRQFTLEGTYIRDFSGEIYSSEPPMILECAREDQCLEYISQQELDHNAKVCNWQLIKYLSIVICVGLACIVCNYSKIIQYFNDNKVYSDIIYDKSKFFNDVTNLGQKYNVTENSILKIKSGIATILQRQDTGSFIFTYNTHNSNFDPVLFDNFMNELVSSSTRFLRNKSDMQDPVVINSSKLNMQVHSELVERYKEDVKKTGVMLVKDLDEVPSSLAMAFHYYCDEFNPLIKNSAIFFTLNMAKCSDKKTSYASIEKCLRSKWTTVPRDNIVPLLTRIVGIIVNIYH